MIMQKINRCITLAILIALSVLAAWCIFLGCASDFGRLYTPSERIALGNGLVGQAADTVTTSMALEDPRVREGNPIDHGTNPWATGD